MVVKKYFSKGVMKFLSVLAVFLVMQTANSACIWVAHQPQFPEVANKFKKQHVKPSRQYAVIYLLCQGNATKYGE